MVKVAANDSRVAPTFGRNINNKLMFDEQLIINWNPASVLLELLLLFSSTCHLFRSTWNIKIIRDSETERATSADMSEAAEKQEKQELDKQTPQKASEILGTINLISLHQK